MNGNSGLSHAQLLSLDVLITAAQQRGLTFNDRFDHTEEQAEAQFEIHEAMWADRHGAFQLSDHDREIVAQMRELASQLELSPTLGQLLELRGEALRGG